ncbi:MAG: OmpA family protein [Proteobacteria bacterium]|uniref:OmpA family protein n=1 Tax=Candidatus Enterousia excrementavium TaxID=2840789 RepID=A0A940DDY5_9PROT|nr:OmpA family protein [Candidatus Enterousia excrementavium]
MKLYRIAILSILILVTGCMQYHSPARNTWPQYLRGASFTDMTETARIAKRPVFLGAGGKLISSIDTPVAAEYGDKVQNDTTTSINYMANLEYELYDALRKPGISVQRAGTDVVVILVRDAIMELNVGDISADGADTLKTVSKILKKYDATFLEIAGYTDAMASNAANALSLDMAQRVGVYLSRNGINTARMFIVGRGATRPIAAQDDIGRLTNRRVEIRIVPAR